MRLRLQGQDLHEEPEPGYDEADRDDREAGAKPCEKRAFCSEEDAWVVHFSRNRRSWSAATLPSSAGRSHRYVAPAAASSSRDPYPQSTPTVCTSLACAPSTSCARSPTMIVPE